MSIFEQTKYLDPRYDHLSRYVNVMHKGFWTPSKYQKLIKDIDAPHFRNKMPFVDQQAVKRTILAIAMIEDKVKTFWPFLSQDIPQTVISDVGGVFGNSEVIHRISYHALAQEVGVSVEEIEQHEILKKRIAYLTKHLESDPKIIGKKRVLKKITLFTVLVERCCLFPLFYNLMSYAKRNRGLKTISALQQSTALEELFHYKFGIELINIIKQDHPNIWDEYLVDLVSKQIKVAHDTEIKLIDWIFEAGVPEHISKEELVNFLNYNFNEACRDLGIDMRFKMDDEMYREKSQWMLLKLYKSEPDFFDNAVGGYADEDEEINIDEFEF